MKGPVYKCDKWQGAVRPITPNSALIWKKVGDILLNNITQWAAIDESLIQNDNKPPQMELLIPSV